MATTVLTDHVIPHKTRHCALCLTESTEMKTCTGCKRRAYCSKECQRKDWGKAGQCHKIWCKVECCEEDLDWEVRKCPDKRKGLGIFALRDIPPLSRIIVEKAFTLEEAENIPRLADLYPKNGTTKEKFDMNSYINDDSEIRVGFRFSRLNHSCNANASRNDVEETDVVVIYSRRLIQKDEEICTVYKSYLADILVKTNPPAWKNLHLDLQMWGIICPSNCACKDSTTWVLVQTTQRLYKKANTYGSMGDFVRSYKAFKTLIGLFNSDPRIVGLYPKKVSLLFDAYQAAQASQDPQLHQEGCKYMEEFLHIVSSTEYPNSACLNRHKTQYNFQLNFESLAQDLFIFRYKDFFKQNLENLSCKQNAVTNEIGRNHGLDGAEVEGVCADPDHGDVEGGEDDEAASDAGFLPPIGNRI